MRFVVLDGWRGLCALVVALHHFHADGTFFHLPFVRGAWLFVDFFFVLSGFVIAHAYGTWLGDGGRLAVFLVRRLGRLWPLHAAILLALVMMEAAKAAAMHHLGIAADNAPFQGETGVAAIASNLLLVHALGLHDGATWNFPSWSISVEFWAYATFGALCLRPWGRSRRAALAVAALGAAVVAAWSREWLHTIADFGYFRGLFGFFTGVLTYRWLADKLWRGLPAATAWEVAAVAMVVLFVAHADKGSAITLAAPLVFAGAVAVFAFSQGAVSCWLATAPACALGRWSYSIYLVHTLVLVALGRAVTLAEAVGQVSLTTPHEVNGVGRVLLTFGAPWIADVAAVLYLGVVVALSACTWRWIERPCQDWVTARTGAWRRVLDETSGCRQPHCSHVKKPSRQ